MNMKNQVIEKIQELNKVFQELNHLVDENYSDDVAEVFDTEYPFTESFDELADKVSTWAETASEVQANDENQGVENMNKVFILFANVEGHGIESLTIVAASEEEARNIAYNHVANELTEVEALEFLDKKLTTCQEISLTKKGVVREDWKE